MFQTHHELNDAQHLFVKTPLDSIGEPYVIVVDDFYPNPNEVRKKALNQNFYQYLPPSPFQVSDIDIEVTSKITWLSSALKTYWGKQVNIPILGYRYNTNEVIKLIEDAIKTKVDLKTWNTMGDWWNGAFHIQYFDETPRAVHHHFKAGDIENKGWSGLVYLSPNAPKASGTSIFKSNETGLCTAEKGPFFDKNIQNYTRVYEIDNIYNRLVLFRENVLHQAAAGFGTEKNNGRLTQTFFFEV